MHFPEKGTILTKGRGWSRMAWRTSPTIGIECRQRQWRGSGDAPACDRKRLLRMPITKHPRGASHRTPRRSCVSSRPQCACVQLHASLAEITLLIFLASQNGHASRSPGALPSNRIAELFRKVQLSACRREIKCPTVLIFKRHKIPLEDCIHHQK